MSIDHNFCHRSGLKAFTEISFVRRFCGFHLCYCSHLLPSPHGNVVTPEARMTPERKQWMTVNYCVVFINGYSSQFEEWTKYFFNWIIVHILVSCLLSVSIQLFLGTVDKSTSGEYGYSRTAAPTPLWQALALKRVRLRPACVTLHM